MPVESLRPFEPNWNLFCTRSSSGRFNQALVEARNPEKYRLHELAAQTMSSKNHNNTSNESASDSMVAVVKRKRGRPPKKRPPETQVLQPPKGKRTLKLPRRPARYDSKGMATKEYILYCRIKLQKILLRKQLKVAYHYIILQLSIHNRIVRRARFSFLKRCWRLCWSALHLSTC